MMDKHYYFFGTLDNNTNEFSRYVKKFCTKDQAISIIDTLKTKYPNKNFGFFSLDGDDNA